MAKLEMLGYCAQLVTYCINKTVVEQRVTIVMFTTQKLKLTFGKSFFNNI